MIRNDVFPVAKTGIVIIAVVVVYGEIKWRIDDYRTDGDDGDEGVSD